MDLTECIFNLLWLTPNDRKRSPITHPRISSAYSAADKLIACAEAVILHFSGIHYSMQLSKERVGEWEEQETPNSSAEMLLGKMGRS